MPTIDFIPWENAAQVEPVWDSRRPLEEQRPLGKLGLWELPTPDLIRYQQASEEIQIPTFTRPAHGSTRGMSDEEKRLRAQRIADKQRISEHMFPGGSAGSIGSLVTGMIVETAWQAWEGVRDFVKNTMTGSSTPSKGKK